MPTREPLVGIMAGGRRLPPSYEKLI
jgi:hypothetical protein